MRLIVAAVVALVLVPGCGSDKPSAPSRFVPGQAWSWNAPASSPDARVLILKVEKRGALGTVIHIAVDQLALANPRGTTPEEQVVRVIAHIPMTEDALAQSVNAVVAERTAVPPDWERGYDRWRESYRARTASAWKRPLAEVIDTIAQGFQK